MILENCKKRRSRQLLTVLVLQATQSIRSSRSYRKLALLECERNIAKPDQ